MIIRPRNIPKPKQRSQFDKVWKNRKRVHAMRNAAQAVLRDDNNPLSQAAFEVVDDLLSYYTTRLDDLVKKDPTITLPPDPF